MFGLSKEVGFIGGDGVGEMFSFRKVRGGEKVVGLFLEGGELEFANAALEAILHQ